MKITGNSLSPIVQNVILGSVTGVMVGFVIRVYYQYVSGTDIVWILFFVVGPLIGYLSGRERERVEKLKKEKQSLQENLDKIQAAFKRSTNTYRTLIESASDAIFLTTKDGRFVLFNEATCLLSGYKREELKKMTLPQLQLESDEAVKHHKAWLDNGICRYEDKWATKDGGEIFLEVNVKWMQINGYELVLHIGRDILRRKETDDAGKSDEIKSFQTDKITELARMNQINREYVFRPVQKMMDNVQKILNDLNLQEQKQKFADSLSEWEKARKFIMGFEAKSQRDLNETPSQWNLNEIIIQEFLYLEKTVDTTGFVVQTSFSDKLPPVLGIGRDFSLVFNPLFQAIIESLKASPKKEIVVTTNNYNEKNVVEVKFPESENLELNLMKVVDPLFKRGAWMIKKQKLMGKQIAQEFVKSVGGELEIASKNGKGTVVKIRIPAAQPGQAGIQTQGSKQDSAKSAVL